MNEKEIARLVEDNERNLHALENAVIKLKAKIARIGGPRFHFDGQGTWIGRFDQVNVGVHWRDVYMGDHGLTVVCAGGRFEINIQREDAQYYGDWVSLAFDVYHHLNHGWDGKSQKSDTRLDWMDSANLLGVREC